MKTVMIFFLLIFPLLSQAHPVSFKGSTGVMGYHSPMLTHNQLNYSFKHWWAVGVHHLKLPNQKNRSATFASSNFLLKRWNGSSYQGNLYANIGAGESNLSGQSESAGFGLLQFDIEDRNYYFLAKHSGLVTPEQTDFYQTVIRAGIAPYVESFDGIHTWLILEWQESVINHQLQISDLTPFLRVFYQNILFEVGQSFSGVTRFNYITHF